MWILLLVLFIYYNLGSIPIVINSTLYPIYKETTSLVLGDFKHLTSDMLNQPELYIKNMNFSNKILMMKTWIKKIDHSDLNRKYYMNFNN